MKRSYWLADGFVVPAAAAALGLALVGLALVGLALVGLALVGLAGCSGGSGSTPSVASLPAGGSSGGGPSSGSSTGSGAKANATQLLDEWAACMRGIGDAGQTDPTIDSNEVIQISIPFRTGNQANFSGEAHNSSGPCGHYLQQASKLLLGGQPSPPPPSTTQVLGYAKCMRANGVPKYPDPSASGRYSLRGIDMNSQVFKNADKLCSAKYGMVAPGTPEPPGSIQVETVGGPRHGIALNSSAPANGGAGGNG